MLGVWRAAARCVDAAMLLMPAVVMVLAATSWQCTVAQSGGPPSVTILHPPHGHVFDEEQPYIRYEVHNWEGRCSSLPSSPLEGMELCSPLR